MDIYVEDIPYIEITINNEIVRQYILPNINLVNDDNFVIDMSFNNEFNNQNINYNSIFFFNIPNYNINLFQVINGHFIPQKYINNIYMNGTKIYIPPYYKSQNKIFVLDIYDLLGIDVDLKYNIIKEKKEICQKMDIILGSILSNKLQKNPKILYKNKIHNYDEIFKYWYLTRIVNKYDSVSTPFIKEKATRNHILDILYDEINGKIYKFEKDHDKYEYIGNGIRLSIENPKYNKIIIPITIHPYKTGKDSHSNFLLIDLECKKDKGVYNIYVFDPHGKSYINNIRKMVNLVFNKWFKLNEEYGYKFNIIVSDEWTPNKSLQYLEYKNNKKIDYRGTCELWTLWTIEILLANQHIEYDRIIREMILNMSKYEKDFLYIIKLYEQEMIYLYQQSKSIKNDKYYYVDYDYYLTEIIEHYYENRIGRKFKYKKKEKYYEIETQHGETKNRIIIANYINSISKKMIYFKKDKIKLYFTKDDFETKILSMFK